jgi:LAS superfamily LD-carboxypeptidase LdcB
VRYLVVAVASVLTSCAGIGSFMTASAPTQDYCASRGLTLDAAIKQCVVPPPASQGADTTGSLPSPTKKVEQQSPPPLASAQPTAPKPLPQQSQPPQLPPETQQTQFQEKRESVPIEQDAHIKPDSQASDMATEFAHFVRASGYRCDSVSAMAQHYAGVTLACNRSTFRYAINKDKDDRWTVAVE